jgi:hypothetical protein
MTTKSPGPFLIKKMTKHRKIPIPVWCVEFHDAKGRHMRTEWTQYLQEACAWGIIIRDHGWCASARPGPV